MQHVWQIASQAKHRCNKIDHRSTCKRPWDGNAWSRSQLQNACKHLWYPREQFPVGLRKHVYANALMLLRMMRRLEERLPMRFVKSNSCSICKEELWDDNGRMVHPIFRCKESGYHLVCIRNYMLVSYKLRDPHTRQEFTDNELKWCDTMAARHKYERVDGRYAPVKYDRDDRSLHALKHDHAALEHRRREEQEEQLRDEHKDLLIDAIRADMSFLEAMLLANAGLEPEAELTRHFAQLVRCCETTAQEQLHVLREANTNEQIGTILGEIEEQFPTWRDMNEHEFIEQMEPPMPEFLAQLLQHFPDAVPTYTFRAPIAAFFPFRTAVQFGA